MPQPKYEYGTRITYMGKTVTVVGSGHDSTYIQYDDGDITLIHNYKLEYRQNMDTMIRPLDGVEVHAETGIPINDYVIFTGKIGDTF